MVGGTVIEVCEVPDRPDVLYVDCADMPSGRTRPDTCAILVVRNDVSDLIRLGDSLWWQGDSAYWTPLEHLISSEERKRHGHESGKQYDIKIPRVGNSGVQHPGRKGSA